MAKLSKRNRAIREKVEAGKLYPVEEAVALLAELSAVKFKESVDVAVNLGVDPRKSDQNVRGASVLPHGTGKTVRVAVFAQGAKAEEAKEAGADVVGFDDLAEKVQAGELDFDVVIAAPDAMRVVGKPGTILGPRGLMPNPKVGTVTPDVAQAVKNAGGQCYRTIRADYSLHRRPGGPDSSAIMKMEALIADLKKAKPSSARGLLQESYPVHYHGPGLSIDPASLAM